MSDFFLRLVQRTAKFDRKRFGEDIKFLHNQTAAHNHSAQQTNYTNTQYKQINTIQQPAGLDFFGYNEKRTATQQTQNESGSASVHTKHQQQALSEFESGLISDESESISSSDVDESDSKPNLDSDADLNSSRAPRLFSIPLQSNNSTPHKSFSSTSISHNSTLMNHIESIKQLKKIHQIHTSGSDIPAPIQSFENLISQYKVDSYLIENLMKPVPEGCGFNSPTPIQMQAIPILLKNREILACALTGSGKSAAFIVPILATLKKPSSIGYRAIVLSPTRELAEQIYRQFIRISAGKHWQIQVLTKTNANNEAKNLKKRDVLITTPMRLVQLIEKKEMDLSSVQYLIMDEADRLFELGFLEQVDSIMNALTHKSLKRALFSATMPQGVETLARTILNDPIRVTIGARNSAQGSVKQSLQFVGTEEGKLLAFRSLIQSGLTVPMLIFVQSKNRAQQLHNELMYDNLKLDSIHSDKSQNERNEIIRKFRCGEIWILICTDLMARGIDFKGVNCVLNYDFPQSTTSYIHRIGRTGRGGRSGEAITYFTEIDKPLLRSIALVIQHSGGSVASWMLNLDKLGQHKAKHIAQFAPARKPISSVVAQKQKEFKEEKRQKAIKRKEKTKPSSSTTTRNRTHNLDTNKRAKINSSK